MALFLCPECRKNISDSARSCPSCGYLLTVEKIAEIKKRGLQAKNGCAIGCFSIIIFLLFICLLVYLLSSHDGSSDYNTTSLHEVVENSSWDGSVYQVKLWMDANLKDPDSLEFIEWSSVSKTTNGGFKVRAKYRAKNSFGGYVIENKVFFLNSDGIVMYQIDY